jgi:hypothetical protein
MNRARDKPVEWTAASESFPLDGEPLSHLGRLGGRSTLWSWQELNAADVDLSLTGFDPGGIDGLLAIPDEERADAPTPISDNPMSGVGDFVDLRKASGGVRRCNPGRKMSRGSLAGVSRS